MSCKCGKYGKCPKCKRKVHKPKTHRMKGGANLSNAFYDFKTSERIICIGDIEGQYPFDITPAQDYVPCNKKTSTATTTPTATATEETKPIAPTAENPIFSIDSNNMIKITLENNNELVFSGDGSDHGKWDIRLLDAFSKSDANVICTIGNREINKIRMIDECFICDEKGELCWLDHTGSLHELVIKIVNNWGTYKFKYDFSHINESRFKNWPNSTNFDKLYTNDINRIIGILSTTFGITEPSNQFNSKDQSYESLTIFRTQELIEMGIITSEEINAYVVKDTSFQPDLYKKYQSVLYCVTNMMMGVMWTGINYSKLPTSCDKICGLYMQQILKSHIVACFEYNINGVDKLAFVSHCKFDDTLTFPFGNKEGVQKGIVTLESILADIESSKNTFVDVFNKFWNTYCNNINHYDGDFISNYRRYIEISGPISDGIQSKKVRLVNVWVRPDGMAGGSDVDYVSNTKTLKLPEFDMKLCGHTPVGIVPYVEKTETGKYSINMDISVVGLNPLKNQFITRGAFAYTQIDRDGIKMVGYFPKPYENNPDYLGFENIQPSDLIVFSDGLADGYAYKLEIDTFISKFSYRFTNANPFTKPPKLLKVKPVSVSVISVGGKLTKPKKTQEKVLLGKKERLVYKLKNSKFVKVKGAFVSLKDARKMF